MRKKQRIRFLNQAATYVGLSCIFLVAGCNSGNPSPASKAADEAAVRKVDEDWSKAAKTNKPEDWMAFYSDDVVVLPPDDVKTEGKEKVGRVIAAMLAMPGIAISWEPQKVEVAQSGDLAYTQGAYVLTANDSHGKPVTEHGKTLEVWKKQADGGWKCIVDMWSPNTPPTPAS